MSNVCDAQLARRNFLALTALGAGTLLMSGQETAQAEDAPPSQLLDMYAAQDARPDGKPVFWLTRGREYLLKDGKVMPVYDRHIITAARLEAQPGGGFKRPYTETAFATMPGRDEVSAMLQSPLTGKSYPNPLIHPARLTLWVSSTGEITQTVKLDKPEVTSSYRGKLSLVNGLNGKPMVASEINARAVTPNNVLDLTELGPYEVGDVGATDEYTPASRQVVVFRDAPAYLTGGVPATMIGIHPSRKFASLGDVMNELTPTEKSHYQVWVDNWERLLNAKEDVVVQ
jgi:hypothetical protein